MFEMLARCSRRSCDQSEVQVAFACATVPLGGAFCRAIEGAAIPPTATFALRRFQPARMSAKSGHSVAVWRMGSNRIQRALLQRNNQGCTHNRAAAFHRDVLRSCRVNPQSRPIFSGI